MAEAFRESLATLDFVHKGQNLFITGSSGTGKSYLVCALGHEACKRGFCTFYANAPKLLGALKIAKVKGTLETELKKIERLKSGLGSERKVSVLVMAESEPCEPKKKGQKCRKVGHLNMKVMKDLKPETVNRLVGEGLSKGAKIDSDAYPSHGQLEKVVSEVNAKVVKPKDTPKALPWVHTAIANAKSLFRDMFHGIKDEFLQEYLNEFCYNFNRRYFGDRVFDRLVIAAVSYKPNFEHRMYGYVSPKCG